MKLGERYFDDNGKLIVQKVYDPNPTLKQVEDIREAGKTPMTDGAHVARFPMWMINEWLKEAGVAWDDHDAVQDVIRKKVVANEHSAFHVYQKKAF